MKTKAWIFAGLYYLGILGLSSIPGRDLPDTGITFADKPAHLAIYSVLGFLLGRTAGKPLPLFGLGLLLGALDECYQSLTPGRSPDPADWAADALGVAAGLALCLLWKSRRATK